MKSPRDWFFGAYILPFIFMGVITSQQSCPPPDYPVHGNYTYWRRGNKFQPGDKVTYNCAEAFTLMGKETTKCKSNGDWSNPTPFCDMRVRLKNLFSRATTGIQIPSPQISDGNLSTCFSLKGAESLEMTLARKGSVYAIRIFLETGTTKIEIQTGSVICKTFSKFVETRQWILIECNKNEVMADSVKIQDKSDRRNNSTFCEIEAYVKEEDGCESPPDIRIANGYLAVSRSTSTLICEEGYKSNNTRLVCERNRWIGTRLQCSEILCDPSLNFTDTSRNDWFFLDAVKKISAGTRRQLRCDKGYVKTGAPDIITCQKNGLWTKTNATCTEVKSGASTKTIIIGVVGTVVVLIIVGLLGTTIYFVKRQRRREVVVVYKQPTDGSVISGSEGDYASAYYESIQSNSPASNLVPQPPTTSRPTAQMLSDGYFLPLDGKDTLKKQPMPADIAFGTLKPSILYNFEKKPLIL